MIGVALRPHLPTPLGIVALALLSAACNITDPRAPGIYIESGDGVSDTAAASLQGLQVVVVGENGTALPGVEVSVTGGACNAFHPGGFRCRTYARPHVDTTDATGRVVVQVVLGHLAGADSLILTASGVPGEAIARYTVLPGSAVDVAVLPRDTAVYVGRQFPLRGSTVDRWGNPRDETVAYEASPEVQIEGNALSGRALGRARVIASSGVWRDTGWVSVVPHGRAVALLPHLGTGDTSRLVFFHLDGSAYRSFDIPYWRTALDWGPGGLIVMQDGQSFGSSHLMMVDTSGQERRLVSAEVGLQHEVQPQFSADGAWVYFSGLPPGFHAGAIWRVRPDGSGAERVGLEATQHDGNSQPSPSPDGTRVVHGRTPDCCYSIPLLRILHLGTGAVDTLRQADGSPVPGSSPRWSPAGDVIAFTAPQGGGNVNANTIWLVQPDGSNQRRFSLHAYRPFIDWSPDGRWLIAASFTEDRLHLIEPSTGMTLPLAFTKYLRDPAWSP